jgi:hypothetical protein
LLLIGRAPIAPEPVWVASIAKSMSRIFPESSLSVLVTAFSSMLAHQRT